MDLIPKPLVERHFRCRGEAFVARVFLLNHCLLCIAYRGEEPVDFLDPKEHLLPAHACLRPDVVALAERYLDVVLAFWAQRECA